MAKCTVKFMVQANTDSKEIYICGNIKELGAWDLSNAIKLTLDENTNLFTVTKKIEAGTNVEYKIMLTKSWKHVEKGMWKEDIANHSFVAEKGHKEEILVHYFA